MIPQEKAAAVSHALDTAFGVTGFEDIQTIKDLAASSVFRIIVRGSPYLLKISTRTNDPARHYACMQAAAEAGLAPHIWYTSLEDRISITDFIETKPFPVGERLRQIPASLRSLHALPAFPEVPNRINTSCTSLLYRGTAMEGFIETFQSANIIPKSQSDELLTRYAEIAAVYPQNGRDLVSSHNDLFRPDNILFDGNRTWLIDWEAAFLNDRYADLAVVANLLVFNELDESTCLRGYFGRVPDDYDLARFFLMQQISHVFYSLVFLLLGSCGKPVDLIEPAPEFRQFQQGFWVGEADIADSQAKVTYGRAHLEQLFQNAKQARYTEALQIMSDPHSPTEFSEGL